MIQMGIWIALAHPTSAEIASRAGFDFVLIDGEHAPNAIPTILDQVRAIGNGIPRQETAKPFALSLA